jgi:hypothetical protein
MKRVMPIHNYASGLVEWHHSCKSCALNMDDLELYVPTNALRQFFRCFLYCYDAPIRISAVILPSSGGILSEFFT